MALKSKSRGFKSGDRAGQGHGSFRQIHLLKNFSFNQLQAKYIQETLYAYMHPICRFKSIATRVIFICTQPCNHSL